jgi:hypothetical protein
MAEWRLGVELSKVSPRGDTSAVPEKHTRAALPVTKAHGEAAAVASVQETAALAEACGTKLTTARVKAVMKTVAEQAPKTPREARTAVRVAAASDRVPGFAPAAPPQDSPQEQSDRNASQDQTTDETDKQVRAFAVLGALRKDAVRMPDAMLDLVPLSFMHESPETESMVRDLVRPGDLMASRGQHFLKTRGAPLPDTEGGEACRSCVRGHTPGLPGAPDRDDGCPGRDEPAPGERTARLTGGRPHAPAEPARGGTHGGGRPRGAARRRGTVWGEGSRHAAWRAHGNRPGLLLSRPWSCCARCDVWPGSPRTARRMGASGPRWSSWRGAAAVSPAAVNTAWGADRGGTAALLQVVAAEAEDLAAAIRAEAEVPAGA